MFVVVTGSDELGRDVYLVGIDSTVEGSDALRHAKIYKSDKTAKKELQSYVDRLVRRRVVRHSGLDLSADYYLWRIFFDKYPGLEKRLYRSVVKPRIVSVKKEGKKYEPIR